MYCTVCDYSWESRDLRRTGRNRLRSLPIDTTAIQLLATGSVQPVAVWAELADGSRKPIPDAQEKDESGMPYWNVEALAPPVEEKDRAELVSVRVALRERPEVTQFAPIDFTGLVCRVSVNNRTGALGQYWSALAVLPARPRPVPSPVSS